MTLLNKESLLCLGNFSHIVHLGSYPTQITVGRDGNLWFTMVQGNGQVAHGLDTPPYFSDAYGEVGKMTLDGTFSMFALPSPHTSLSGIVAGPDGNLWFTEAVRMSNTTSIHKIGHLTSSGSFSEFALTPLSGDDITGPIIAGPDGNLWFAIESTGPNYDALGKIGRITPQGALTIFTLGLFTVPQDLIVGSDHNLWFTSGSSIGRMTTDGRVRTFTPSGKLNNRIYTGGLTLGTDGAIWFATANVAVGRITTDGKFKFYPFPANTYFDNGSSSLTIGELKGITSGTDGTLWLTDSGQIGHFV